MKVPPLPPAETPSLTCVRVVIITSDEKRIVDDVSSLLVYIELVFD